MRTYEESVREWFLRKHGDMETYVIQGYDVNGRVNRKMIPMSEALDRTQPVELHFEYDEGYSYSEYTYENQSCVLYVRFYTLPELGGYSSRELYRNESIPMNEIIKEILEISQEE